MGMAISAQEESTEYVEMCMEHLTHWARLGSFKMFKRLFQGFLTILTL